MPYYEDTDSNNYNIPTHLEAIKKEILAAIREPKDSLDEARMDAVNQRLLELEADVQLLRKRIVALEKNRP